MTIEEFLDKGPELMMAYWEKLPAEEKRNYLTEDERLDGISEEIMLERISVDKLEQHLKKLKNQ